MRACEGATLAHNARIDVTRLETLARRTFLLYRYSAHTSGCLSILDLEVKGQALGALRALRSAKPVGVGQEMSISQELAAQFVAESAGIEGLAPLILKQTKRNA